MTVYCLRSSNQPACVEFDSICDYELSIPVRTLTYLIKHRSKISDDYRQAYLRDSVYNRIIKNFQLLSKSEIKDIFNLIETVHNKLDENEKSYLIKKVSGILNYLGYNIDIEQGLMNTENDVYLLNDGSSTCMSYIKFATRE